MHLEFVIPLNKEDLQSRTSTSQYVVDELVSPRQLKDQLYDCKAVLRNQGGVGIIEKFDLLYSILINFNTLNDDMKEDTWELLLKFHKNHCTVLEATLDTALDTATKHKHRTAVKMNTYLLCQFMEAFEAEATKPSVTLAPSGKGRKKVSRRKLSGIDWDVERGHYVDAMSHILQLQICRLWEPPVVEEDYVK
ncbi:condensin complex subunit 1-like [Saccoglossus kowalevskii]